MAACRRPRNRPPRRRERCIREARARMRKSARAAPTDEASPQDRTPAHGMARTGCSRGASTPQTRSRSRTLQVAGSACAGLGGSCWTRASPAAPGRPTGCTTHTPTTPRASAARGTSRSRRAMGSKTTAGGTGRLPSARPPAERCRQTDGSPRKHC
jgi:hypothetical protein